MSQLFETLTGESWKRRIVAARTEPNCVRQKIQEKIKEICNLEITKPKQSNGFYLANEDLFMRRQEAAKLSLLPGP